MNSPHILDIEHKVTKAVQLWLVRHGETEWSATGQHTGRTDLPLTLEGKLHARQIGGLLNGRAFALVLTSPLQRARETCRLAGYGESAIVDANLQEWDYGEYEGRTTPEIQIQRPGWSLWRDGVIGGERIEQVAARAQKVIDRARPPVRVARSCSPMGIFSVFSQRAGWVCRRRPAASSPWVQPR